MLSTDAFNYVNVLDKAADASWSRENILTNNIANVNTPGYKRKDLNFENTLKTNDSLNFAVITGCLRVSKESIFTGLNNLDINSIMNDN